jgi:Acyl-CoA dehydrogenases
MDFAADPAEAAFREEIRAFLKANLPRDLEERGRRHYTPTREEMLRWQSILHAHGYAQPHWAVEHGGKGWSGRQRMIFDQELAKAHAPVTNCTGLRAVRAGAQRLRHARAASAVSGATARRRGRVVPGLFRTGIGVGPRVAPDERRSRRRQVDREWPEDLDQPGEPCRLVLSACADEQRRQEAGRQSPSSSST